MKIVTAGYILAVIAISVLAIKDIRPWEPVVSLIPWGDKWCHFVVIGILSLLVNLSWNAPEIGVGRLAIFNGTLLLLVIMTVEEMSQLFFPTRTFSWWDLAFNYAGILTFGEFGCRLVRRAIGPRCV